MRMITLLCILTPLPLLAGPQDLASLGSCWSATYAARHVGATAEATLTTLSLAVMPEATLGLDVMDGGQERLAVVASFDGARDHVVVMASCRQHDGALGCRAGGEAGGFVLTPSEAGVVLMVGSAGFAFEPSRHHALRPGREVALTTCPQRAVAAEL